MKDKELSKRLSFILRHRPDSIGIVLDENGWTNIDVLVNRMNLKGFSVSRADIERVVETNDKQRFAIDGNWIRASQGHSVKVNLGYTPATPPSTLYHGTSELLFGTISTEGIKKMGRHHVHLSSDIKTARKVGERKGKPIIFFVRAGKMHEDGYVFYKSDNGVWLTDYIPPQYIAT